MSNLPNYLTAKTTINDIEEKQDKNSNLYFKITAQLGIKTQILYAFNFDLKTETLQLLTNSPERLVNQRVTITYQELENKDGNGTFYRIKAIEI